MSAARSLAALTAALLLVASPRAQAESAQHGEVQQAEVLHADVRALLEQALTAADPAIDADRLWQACSARHGTAAPLIAALDPRLGDDARGARAARLLIGVLRYEGLPQRVLRVDRRIAAEHRTVADDLTRAELFDTVGRTKEAQAGYDALLARELPAELRQQILFRRALLDKESADGLEQFARAAERTVDERNQAAMVLALRDRPQAAVELFEVRGESTARFRELIRLCEWALAAGDHDRAQQLAWEAVECAKMRRDHRYALTVAVSAYRAGGDVEALLQRFAQASELSADARQVWIDLLRDEGRVDDALRLFRAGGSGEWTVPLRRQLLEICRDTGREEVLVETFGQLIAAEPEDLEWRSGLSRHHLENGDRVAAEAVWSDYAQHARTARSVLDAAYGLRELGLDDLALQTAERAAQEPGVRQAAYLFAVGLHLSRGRFEPASAMLARIEAEAAPRDGVHAEVAGFYERMDRIDRAVEVLERLRAAHDGFLGTDLEMKFALLLSKVDREAEALTVWRALWVRMRNTPRGRYVEDRMMTVAARLGALAGIAIELEERLESGQMSTADVELLVRLYIKVGDSAAATEIIEEYLQRSDAADLEIIRRKANIYLSCQDYVEYEQMIEQLVERDEENRLDHLRELLLSRLERGRRDQAIAQLPAIRAASGDDQSADEFEAGVYQLAGLTDRALTSYVKSLGRHPDRIDTHLLVANLMRENGAEMQAARRFQYLASSADEDDLFTIAIDGILNLRAVGNMVPDEVVDWAMRLVLERLARKPDKFYLYRLAADLAEELGDLPLAIRTLVAGLPAAGERRTAVLRELLGKLRQLDPRARNLFGSAQQLQISDDWDPTQYVALGRRLLGQGEIVPPQVFMELAAVFLKVDAVADAMRTFSRAAELLDRSDVHRQAAQVLEGAKRYDAALKFYRRLLAVETNDVGLLAKIAQLEELSGNDSAAAACYRRGLETALQQTALQVHVAAEEEPEDAYAAIFRRGNVDAVQAAIPKLTAGLLVTLERADAIALLASLQQRIDADLEVIADRSGDDSRTLTAFPRLQATAAVLRRIALCFRGLAAADAVDAKLLARFPEDRELATEIVRFRADRGFHRSALDVVAGTAHATDPALAWIAGGVDVGEGFVLPATAAARVVPLLGADPGRLRAVLERVDTSALTSENLDIVSILLAACVAVDAPEAAERIARATIRVDAGLSDRERSLRDQPGMRAVKLAGRVHPDLRSTLTRAIVDRAVQEGALAVVRLRRPFDGETDLALDTQTAERLLRELVSESGTSASGYVQGMELLRFVPAAERPEFLRELHYLAKQSSRLSLLSQSAAHLEDPLPAPFLEWFEATFAAALRHGNDSQRNQARFAGRDMKSSALDLVRLRALVAVDSNTEVRADLIARLLEFGEREEAIRLLEEGIPDMLAPSRVGSLARGATGPNKGHITQVVRFVVHNGLTEPALKAVDQKLRERPQHEAMRLFRWMLLCEQPTAEALLASAMRRSPEDVGLLEIVYQYHRDRGHLVEAAEIVERLAADEEGDLWQRRLQSLQRQLGQTSPAPQQGPPQRGAPRQGATRAATRTAAVSIARATAIATIIGAPSVAGTPQSQPRPVPSIAREILAIADPEAARRRFREYWRALHRDTRYVLPGRGPQVEASPLVLSALAETEFIRAEAARILRLYDDYGPLGGSGVIPELLAIVGASEDHPARLRALAAEIESGVGGNLESALVLQLLASEKVDAALRTEMLGRLERRIEMPDAGRLRLMAREFARVGRSAGAAVLYRLGVLGMVRDRYAPRGREAEEAAELFAEVESSLDGDLGRELVLLLVDDLLQTKDVLGANAGAVEVLALQTWSRLLSPEAAAERGRLLRDRIAPGQFGRDYMNRYGKGAELAVALAGIFNAVGDFAAATDEWEQFVRFSAGGNRFTDIRSMGRRSLPQAQLLQFADAAGERRVEWLQALGRSSLQWDAEGELKDPVAVLGTLARACAKAAGDEATAVAETGEAIVAALRELAARDTRALSELAKVERALGRDAAALAIEVELLAARRLPIADHARVVRALGERDGAEAALAAGEKALTYTADTKLLETLVELCEQAGQPERAAPWREALKAREPKESAGEPAEPKRG